MVGSCWVLSGQAHVSQGEKFWNGRRHRALGYVRDMVFSVGQNAASHARFFSPHAGATAVLMLDFGGNAAGLRLGCDDAMFSDILDILHNLVLGSASGESCLAKEPVMNP